MVGTVGGAADVVLDDQVGGMLPAPPQEPIRQQGGLAAAGVPEQQHRSSVARRVAIQSVEVFTPPDIGAPTDLGEGLVVLRLAGQRVGDVFLGKLRLDGRGEIGLDHGGKFRRGRVVVAQGNRRRLTRGADQRFQRGLFLGIGRGVGDEVGAAVLGPGRIAEIEEGPAGHVGVVQDTVEDFQLRHALAAQAGQPGLLFPHVGGEGLVAGGPAVALAEQADEERTAGVDLVQAEL